MCNEITVIRTFEASRREVFAAWVAPASLVAPVTRIEMDPVVGGNIRISSGGLASEDLVGVFLKADVANHLVYTWRWGAAAEETIVDVEFLEAGPLTVVQVRQRGFLGDESKLGHLAGWSAYLDGLAAYV